MWGKERREGVEEEVEQINRRLREMRKIANHDDQTHESYEEKKID